MALSFRRPGARHSGGTLLPASASAVPVVPPQVSPRPPVAPFSASGVPSFPLTGYPVRILTPTHAITGTVSGAARLLDLLNSSQAVHVVDAHVLELGAPTGDAHVEPEVLLDPFEIDVAVTRPLPDAPWVRARHRRKLAFPVTIDAGLYRIEGSVHVFAGADPTAVGQHASGVFIPVTEPVVRRSGRIVFGGRTDTVILNRHLVREITVCDRPGAVDLAGAVLAQRAAVA